MVTSRIGNIFARHIILVVVLRVVLFCKIIRLKLYTNCFVGSYSIAYNCGSKIIKSNEDKKYPVIEQ